MRSSIDPFRVCLIEVDGPQETFETPKTTLIDFPKPDINTVRCISIIQMTASRGFEVLRC